MAGAAAKIDQARKAAEMESRHYRGRTQPSKAMHPALEFAHGAFRTEEVREDRPFKSESLFPTMTSFANRVFQMSPHRLQHIVGILDVARQRVRAVGRQILAA